MTSPSNQTNPTKTPTLKPPVWTMFMTLKTFVPGLAKKRTHHSHQKPMVLLDDVNLMVWASKLQMGFNITQFSLSKSENIPTEKQSPEMGLKPQKVPKHYPPPPPPKQNNKAHKSKPPKSTRKFGNCSIHSSLHHVLLSFGAWILGEVLEALGASMVMSSSQSLAGRIGSGGWRRWKSSSNWPLVYKTFSSLWMIIYSWWLNQPIWKNISEIGSFPQVGMKI